MIVCGITGHNGNLGKQFIKIFSKFKFEKFQGNIVNKKDVDNWVKAKEFDLIFRHSNILCPLFLLGECISHSMDCVGRSKSSRDGIPFQIQLLTK